MHPGDHPATLARALQVLDECIELARQCKKGDPCGNTCIAKGRVCRVKAQPGAATPKPARKRATKAAAAPAGVAKSDKVESWDTGPGAKAPKGVRSLNGVPFTKEKAGWWDHVPDKDVGEPPPARRDGAQHAIGRTSIMVMEPDGRVWTAEPTGHYGGRQQTMPGGGMERGLSMQKNALKEVWEETGLKVEITGYLGDFKDSNNGVMGRTYIGKRVGGAPWAAPADPKASQFHGRSVAESQKVHLQPPDKAFAAATHVDDKAQIGLAHGVPANLPASHPVMDEIIRATKSRAKEFRRKEEAAGRDPGSSSLHEIAEIRGHNAKPQVVSKTDFDAIVARGDAKEMLRGLSDVPGRRAEQLAQEFRSGDHYAGYGIYGNGTYMDAGRGRQNVAGSGTYGRVVMRCALAKDAKIASLEEIKRLAPAPPRGFKPTSSGNPNSRAKPAHMQWWGLQASLMGYDAIHVGRASPHGFEQNYHVVLNRGKVIVQDRNEKPPFHIP